MANENDTVENADKTVVEPAQTVQIPQSIRNLHSKALAALERNNTDIAIDIFLRCVEQCPTFTAARRNLRLTEIARFKAANKQNSLAHRLSSLTGAFQAMKVKALVKTGKLEEALVECEKLLLIDPLNLSFVKLFAETAIQAGHVDDGLMTAELVREHLPAGNLPVVELLGKLYFGVKNYRKAREFLERAHRAKPNDAAIASMLKNSEALGTLDSGWDVAAKGGSFRDALADKDAAAKLEQEGKMVMTADDAESLIAEAVKKVEAEPKNVNYYLNLVGLYNQQKRYDEALRTIEKARELVGADAELDRRFSSITIAKFDAEIAALREAGDAEGATAKETARNQYVFDDIADRVQRYPNDQHLRYELGLQYFKYEYFDDAIGQFQLAQRSPKERVESLYYLAKCFSQKGQRDMAVMQLETANEQLMIMDDLKKKVVFELGSLAEAAGDIEKAFGYYKDVYGADIGFQDIGARMERIYKLRQSQQG